MNLSYDGSECLGVSTTNLDEEGDTENAAPCLITPPNPTNNLEPG